MSKLARGTRTLFIYLVNLLKVY